MTRNVGLTPSPPSTTEVSKYDLQAAQILTDLADGGATESGRS